jgi:hypothetical protein
MAEHPRHLGLVVLTDDLGAALLTWRSLGFRVLRLASGGAVLEGEGTRVFVQVESDSHRARDAYPLYYTPNLPQVVDAFESQGGRMLETREIGGAPVHLLVAPTGHRLAITGSPL